MLRGVHALTCFPSTTLIYVVVDRNISRKWCRQINLSPADDMNFDWPNNLLWNQCTETLVRLGLQHQASFYNQWTFQHLQHVGREKKTVKPLQPIVMSNVDGTFGILQGKISKTNNHYNILQRIRADPTLKLYNQLPFQQSTVRLGIFQHKTSTTNIHFKYLLHVGRLQCKDYTTYTHFNNLQHVGSDKTLSLYSQ
jgi:hypothetical protein